MPSRGLSPGSIVRQARTAGVCRGMGPGNKSRGDTFGLSGIEHYISYELRRSGQTLALPQQLLQQETLDLAGAGAWDQID
jgi:hypothetical protein